MFGKSRENSRYRLDTGLLIDVPRFRAATVGTARQGDDLVMIDRGCRAMCPPVPRRPAGLLVLPWRLLQPLRPTKWRRLTGRGSLRLLQLLPQLQDLPAQLLDLIGQLRYLLMQLGVLLHQLGVSPPQPFEDGRIQVRWPSSNSAPARALVKIGNLRDIFSR